MAMLHSTITQYIWCKDQKVVTRAEFRTEWPQFGKHKETEHRVIQNNFTT